MKMTLAKQQGLTRRKASPGKRDLAAAYLFLIPLILVIAGLVGYPFFESIWLSLSRKFVGSSEQAFIGFQNYAKLTKDFVFQKAFYNTMIWTFATVVFKVVVGMAMALVLNRNFRGNNLARGLMLVPWILPTPISGLVWVWIFNDMGGILNYILLRLHMIGEPVAWLGTGGLAFMSVIIVNIWRGTPFFGITLLAGLKSISADQYEAAKIDGAGAVRAFWYITLPNLKFVILVAALLESIWAMGDFSIVYVMTKGGPAGATHLISTYTYQIGFLSGDLGRAVAVSLYPLPILALLIVGATYLMERGKNR